MTDPASVDRVLGALEGPFQTVFVSVGILAPDGHAPEKQIAALDPAAMARVFAVNTVGVAQVLCHPAAPSAEDGPVGHRRPDRAGGEDRSATTGSAVGIPTAPPRPR